MAKFEDRVKSVINEINEEHRRKTDKKISSYVFLGFFIGIAFANSPLISFSMGFILGTIFENKFSSDMRQTRENLSNLLNSLYGKIFKLSN